MNQAKSTPFAQQPLNNVLGWDGNVSVADEILDGKWIPPEDTKEYVCEYVKQLESTRIPLDSADNKITIEEYRKIGI